MPIISKTNNIFSVALCIAICALPILVTAATMDQLVIFFGDNRNVAILMKRGKVNAYYEDSSNAKEKIAISPELATIISKSDATQYLMHDHRDNGNLAIIISSVPSKSTSGAGFCGAGHEDYAVLIEKSNNMLISKDRYLLQSCLKSMTIDAEDPERIITGLSKNEANFSFVFSLLEDPKKARTLIQVKNGKFIKNDVPY